MGSTIRVYSILQTEGDNILGLDDSNVPVAPLVDADYQGGTPTLCDTASPANCPVVGAPLMCPVGSVSGGAPLCPLNSPGGTAGFTLSANTWNVDGGNPRVGGSPQYDCPTDDGGGLDVPMWQRMTVSDLFWHRGGFYRGAGLNDVANGNNAKSGDPQYEPIFVSQRLPLNHPPPPTAIDMIRFNAGLCLYYPPLGCDDACCNASGQPGPVDPWGYCTQLDNNTYSNVGYNMLGRIIEVRSGLTYEQYVTQTLLEPLGIDRIKLGKTRFIDRDPREASYYANGNTSGGNLFAAVCEGSDDPNCVGGTWTFPDIIATPDGGDFALEFRDPNGGWTATSCALNQLFHTYRVNDGFRRTPGVYPSGGEGTMMGFYPGTRAYVALWGDPITVVDTVNVPAGCTSWGCLNSSSINFPLGPGWHVAAIFNKDLCTTSVCDAPGGFVFNKHDKQALLNGIAAALVKVSVLPDEVTCGCGNGIRDVGEVCDGYELGTATCTSLGFVGGELGCKADCTYDTPTCSMCGNGVQGRGRSVRRARLRRRQLRRARLRDGRSDLQRLHDGRHLELQRRHVDRAAAELQGLRIRFRGPGPSGGLQRRHLLRRAGRLRRRSVQADRSERLHGRDRRSAQRRRRRVPSRRQLPLRQRHALLLSEPRQRPDGVQRRQRLGRLPALLGTGAAARRAPHVDRLSVHQRRGVRFAARAGARLLRRGLRRRNRILLGRAGRSAVVAVSGGQLRPGALLRQRHDVLRALRRQRRLGALRAMGDVQLHPGACLCG